MSRLTELIRQVEQKDPHLAAELSAEVKALSGRRAFGLNFERHQPEAVELPNRPIRRGDKVRILPERKSADEGERRVWRVVSIESANGDRVAHLSETDSDNPGVTTCLVKNLVVVAEFRDAIYPGLLSTGRVERGDGRPYHSIINGENYHVLKALTYTHRGSVDVIYIDPPYNSGARDWKYNNDYVDSDDLYRHSKWLAFMERRLLLAAELLNPDKSVLIVTIDEREYLRLGLLLEQVFTGADIQMISSVISPQGSARPGGFSRVEEYIYFVMLGSARVVATGDDMLIETSEVATAPVWFSMIRSGTGARREDSKSLFYPIFVDPNTREVLRVGEVLPWGTDRRTVSAPSGVEVVWPIRRDGSEGRWQLSAAAFRKSLDQGFAKVGDRNNTGGRAIMYVRSGDRERIDRGEIVRTGVDDWGYPLYARTPAGVARRAPKSIWNKLSHDAGKQGSMLLGRMLPGRKFPFPKALYAVEDALRLVVADNPSATILDFFAGSGTTAHAVMRLNRQDGGRRQCISVTNNEVAADEQAALRKDGLRPGDPEWERWGICEFITKPRITAAITGSTPAGEPVKGSYKFTDEFPMADGFEENAEFFTLTYETPVSIGHNRAFERVAPLLWLRAGSEGRRISALPCDGWEVTDTYGLLVDLDRSQPFCEAVMACPSVRVAYVVTDDERRFQAVAQRLPDHVEPVRLYESYLTNFRFANGG